MRVLFAFNKSSLELRDERAAIVKASWNGFEISLKHRDGSDTVRG